MNKKQTIVMWVGAMFFVLFAWNPRVNYHSPPRSRHYSKRAFDEGLTALIARLSSTAVITSLAIYTLRDKRKDEGNK